MIETNLLSRLKLSVQRALLGEICSNLFAVTVGMEGKQIKLLAYFTGDITEEEASRMQSIGTEVLADFPEDYSIEVSSLSLHEHNLEMLDCWIFMRSK